MYKLVLECGCCGYKLKEEEISEEEFKETLQDCNCSYDAVGDDEILYIRSSAACKQCEEDFNEVEDEQEI